ADINDVVEYLVTLAGKPGDLAAATRGAAVFANRGQCFDCHEGDGRGDAAIGAPNLTDAVWLYGSGTRDDLYAEISRGLAGFCPAWVRVLDPVTIRALAVLVHASSDSPSVEQKK